MPLHRDAGSPMPPLHGLERQGGATAENRVLVPAAPGVLAVKETDSTSRIRHTTGSVDLRGEESQVVGHVAASWRQLSHAASEPPQKKKVKLRF